MSAFRETHWKMKVLCKERLNLKEKKTVLRIISIWFQYYWHRENFHLDSEMNDLFHSIILCAHMFLNILSSIHRNWLTDIIIKNIQHLSRKLHIVQTSNKSLSKTLYAIFSFFIISTTVINILRRRISLSNDSTHFYFANLLKYSY